MAQQPLPLITFYQGWKTYQHHLVETIAPLSSAQLASPVAPHQEKQPAHDAAELVAAFESTWQMIEGALARWVPTDLGYVVPQPAFLSEGERKVFVNLTRQWILWHVLEHEIHHGGELSLALGGLGLPGVYGNA